AGAAGRDELLALREVFVRYLDGETPGAAAHRDTDDALHAALARMARSPILAEMIANLRLRTRVFDKGEIPDRFEPGCREHIAIIDAVLIGDAEGAQSAMRTHLGNVGQSILAHLTRGTRSS
ncbi:MAG: FCD domain-containing protein, partial [Pseudomonadota bacterium]